MKQKNDDLKQALKIIAEQQEQLLKQEKLASLGTLMAGIAHEIKNPLNFIQNFAALSGDLCDEIEEMLTAEKGQLPDETQNKIKTILKTLQANLDKINGHSLRADQVIQTMLNHSRGKTGEFQLAGLNDLLDEYIHLAYQAVRLNSTGFNLALDKNYDASIEQVELIPHEMGRVFINLVNNACDAMTEKKRTLGKDYSPNLSITTHNLGQEVEIIFRDNGIGIQKGLRNEIFKPFFSTKSKNHGAGLGLALSYDIIVREHSGEITFDSEIEMFTEFRIKIPKKQKA